MSDVVSVKRMPPANRAPRKPVASKNQFLDVLADVLDSKGYGILKDGKIHKSKAVLWDFYKTIKAVEIAMTAASGRVSLAGIGKFEFKMGGRGEVQRPIYRFTNSSAVDEICYSFCFLVI